MSRQDYYSNAHVKKLNPDDFEYVKMLSKTKAKPRILADIMTQRTGKDYNSEEIRYLIQKVATEDKENMPAVEKVLTELRDHGGNVMGDKDPGTKNVDVLGIQTENMKKHGKHTLLT